MFSGCMMPHYEPNMQHFATEHHHDDEHNYGGRGGGADHLLHWPHSHEGPPSVSEGEVTEASVCVT